MKPAVVYFLVFQVWSCQKRAVALPMATVRQESLPGAHGPNLLLPTKPPQTWCLQTVNIYVPHKSVICPGFSGDSSVWLHVIYAWAACSVGMTWSLGVWNHIKACFSCLEVDADCWPEHLHVAVWLPHNMAASQASQGVQVEAVLPFVP